MFEASIILGCVVLGYIVGFFVGERKGYLRCKKEFGYLTGPMLELPGD